jgi:hypothetical protein
VKVIQENPEFTDEQVLDLARQRTNETGAFAWDTIWMQQTEEGDEYSSITDETDNAMPLVKDFLENPDKYIESSFIQDDPAYLAYLADMVI